MRPHNVPSPSMISAGMFQRISESYLLDKIRQNQSMLGKVKLEAMRDITCYRPNSWTCGRNHFMSAKGFSQDANPIFLTSRKSKCFLSFWLTVVWSQADKSFSHNWIWRAVQLLLEVGGHCISAAWTTAVVKTVIGLTSYLDRYILHMLHISLTVSPNLEVKRSFWTAVGNCEALQGLSPLNTLSHKCIWQQVKLNIHSVQSWTLSQH